LRSHPPNINGVGNAGNNILIGNTGDNSLEGGAGEDTLIGGLGKDTYNLTETVATTDTLTIATGDSLVSSYDLANNFKLGTGASPTSVGVDQLNLVNTLIAANGTGDGADVGIGADAISSHNITNGIISFDNLGSYDTPVAVTAATNLANVLSYVEANITGGNTVAFVSEGNIARAV
jgi:Ca2+-binding RTX toxin-like protein